jgi:hypothetical protein
VWIPQSAEGFGVEPYPYLTRDLIPGVTKYAAGNQVWLDVSLKEMADGFLEGALGRRAAWSAYK